MTKRIFHIALIPYAVVHVGIFRVDVIAFRRLWKRRWKHQLCLPQANQLFAAPEKVCPCLQWVRDKMAKERFRLFCDFWYFLDEIIFLCRLAGINRNTIDVIDIAGEFVEEDHSLLN